MLSCGVEIKRDLSGWVLHGFVSTLNFCVTEHNQRLVFSGTYWSFRNHQYELASLWLSFVVSVLEVLPGFY